MKCRHCKSLKTQLVIDLGVAPPSNNYLNNKDDFSLEIEYPLRVFVCEMCWLVQTEDYVKPEDLFTPNYAYMSSTSKSWLLHARLYTDEIVTLLKLNQNSFVVEIASNDGYLLQNIRLRNIPCLGIEPSVEAAEISERKGITVKKTFFNLACAKEVVLENGHADLIIGNNVYAHVPDINEFTQAMQFLLADDGVITLEFPHVLNLIRESQFDTIYHEHFSYLSLYAVIKIFACSNLKVFKVDKLSTHGGSIRVYGCKVTSEYEIHGSVDETLAEEREFGLLKISSYLEFQRKADVIKNNLKNYLIEQVKIGRRVCAYGAAAKGNTLLNFAGIGSEHIAYVYDASKSKINKFLPGSHIPILDPSCMKEYKPDIVVILPWNLAEEIVEVCGQLLDNEVQYVTAIPSLKIWE